MDLDDIDGFDWGHGNREKCQKHGVSIIAVERAFETANVVVPGRTAGSEERFALVSIDERDRGMFVVFTIRTRRGSRLIRFQRGICMSGRNKPMNEQKRLKSFPSFETDEEAETFVETADLAEYDFSDFRPVRFEFQKKAAQINMRVPVLLLDEIKAVAKMRGIPYTRYIREALERDIAETKR